MGSQHEMPLVVALAWVYARDHDFMFEVEKRGSVEIDSILRELNASRNVKITPVTNSVDDAWLLLRTAVAEGRLKLRGVPFEKGHHVNRMGFNVAAFSTEVDVSRGAPPRVIEGAVAEKLMIDITLDKLRLRPIDWYAKGGWWWREVEVDLDDFMTEFSEVKVQAKETREEKHARAMRKLSPAQRAVIEAFMKLRASGRAGIQRKEWENMIIGEIKKSANPPSLSTISRAFRTYREESGTDILKDVSFVN